MTFNKLRITGPGETPYKLGQPMFLYEGTTPLGTLDPVHVRKDGTLVHIAAFAPAQVVRKEPRHVGRLLFLEICVFIAERFPQVQAISFSFSRPTQGQGGPAQLAASRAAAMTRIGAVNVKITPRTSGEHVVSGVWVYSRRNLAALHEALEAQRELFSEHPIGARLLRHRCSVAAAWRRLFPRNSR